jgi:Acetyltransferase (GNAT) domain
LKRLRKCRREGLVAEPLALTELGAVHSMLVECRAGKGRTTSMSLPQLQAMADRFPHAIHLFGVRDAGLLAAGAVCLRLDPRTLYVFMWGDRPAYARFSPVVPLAEAIYAHCQAEGVGLLDVGTSTEDAVANFGLIRFKRGLGFRESLKLRLLRDPHAAG